MVIQVNTLIAAAVTEADGTAVFAELSKALRQQDIVTLSFTGLKTASTSFVNTAFVPLLDLMSFEEIKRRLKVVESTRQINHMIKWRLEALANIVSAAE
jgi:STAS-like domain of unknown function (DUF4325)